MSDVFTIQGSYNLVDNVSRNLDRVSRNVNRTGRELLTQEKAWGKIGEASKRAVGKIDAFVKKSAVLVSGLTAGMVTLGVKSNASLESSRASWETLLGSQEKAQKMLDDITKYAATTPFSKMGVDEMAKQLKNAGFEGDELFEQLTKFGDMGGAFGVQEDSLKEMVRQYGQVQMAQVAYTEDLNILQDRGIPIYKALSEVMGVSVADVKKMASEGKITADVYNKAIDEIAKTTEGAMDKQSKTFNGMWSTIKDNFTNLMQKIIEPLFEKILEVMPKIIEFFDNFSKKLDEGGGFLESIKASITEVFGEEIMGKIERMIGIVTNLVAVYAALKAVMFVSGLITSLSSAWGVLSAALGVGSTATTVATGAQTGFNVALWACPITWIIAAIAALVAAFIWLWNNVDEFREFWEWTWDGVCKGFEVTKNFIVEKFTWIKDKAKKIFNDVKYAIQNPIESAKNFIGEKFDWIKNKATTVFEKVKDVIQKPIKAAREFFGKQIEKIKNFLNFKWEFPKLKMPHFSVTGSMNPFDWISEGVPKIGVEWYSKGGIFTQPTILGNIGVGDAQNGVGSNAEAVMPIDDLRGMIKDLLQVEINLLIDGKEFVRQVVAPHNEEITTYNRQYVY